VVERLVFSLSSQHLRGSDSSHKYKLTPFPRSVSYYYPSRQQLFMIALTGANANNAKPPPTFGISQPMTQPNPGFGAFGQQPNQQQQPPGGMFGGGSSFNNNQQNPLQAQPQANQQPAGGGCTYIFIHLVIFELRNEHCSLQHSAYSTWWAA
jgi:hypothetical protein